MKVTAVTSQPVALPETTVSKSTETTSTADVVTLSPTARAAAAGGVPLFAVSKTTDRDSISIVADKKKTEARVKQMEKEAAVLEKQYTDEQATKMDQVDRLGDRTKLEQMKKKEMVSDFDSRSIQEDQRKDDSYARLGDHAKDEEVMKGRQIEKAIDGGNTAQLDQLLKRAKDEETKKAQATERLDLRAVSEEEHKNTQSATFDRIGKTEQEYKKRKIARLDSRFISEAEQKRERINTLADSGDISLEDAKDLLSLVDKNLEDRIKQLSGDTKAVTEVGDPTATDANLPDVSVKSA